MCIDQEKVKRAQQISAAANIGDVAAPLFSVAAILGYRQRVAQDILKFTENEQSATLNNLNAMFDDCNEKINKTLGL